MVLERAPASDFGSTLHAVLVGVDALPGNWLARLSVAERDARSLAGGLTYPDGCAAPQAQVQALTGQKADRDSVLEALRTAVARMGPNDTLVFYFAGHGLSVDGLFWLCTAGTEANDLQGTGLGSGQLEAALSGCIARGILVVLDCCEGAAFAEAAPATFTRLRAGEYRLLVSASRADQKSWETKDRSGTLFSRALLGVLVGEIQVGRIPGAIYFSDLVDAIDAYVSEGLEHRPEHPRQEMMFVGSYVRDPLIFVHRGLSLAQVRFATVRYSAAHLRRILVRGAALISATLLFILTVAYGFQDKTEFARIDNGKIVILRGQPLYNLPGYPKLLWSLAYGSERLEHEPGQGPFLLAAPLGRSVMPLIEDRLRLDYKLLALYGNGRLDEAHNRALAAFSDPATPFAQKLNVGLMLARLATLQDVPLLKEWLNGERKELRLAAFLALLRLEGTRSSVVGQTLAGEELAEHQDIVRSIEGPCTSTITSYLERRFDASSSHPTNAEVLDAAVRTNCLLSVPALARAVARPHLFGERNVALYARYTGRERALADQLVQRLEAGGLDPWSAAGVVGTLAEIEDAPCSTAYDTGLNSPIAVARLMSMSAIARHCRNPVWSAAFDPSTRRFRISAEADGQSSTLWLDPYENDALLSLRYLIDLPRLGLGVAGLTEALRQVLPVVEDTQVKSEIIAALIRERSVLPLPSALLDSNSLEVRSKAVELRRLQRDKDLSKQLLSRIGGGDDFYVGSAGRMPLTEGELDTLRARLTGSEDERRQIACVLAMRDTSEGVLSLLQDPDWIVREQAVACSPFNGALEDIVKDMPQSVSGFPIEGFAALQEQAGRKRALERAIANLPPDQKLWLLGITDKTPAGFGLYGFGMRAWIDEQIFRASVVEIQSQP